MAKVGGILLGLVLLIVPIYAWIINLGGFGISALEFLKGGIMWLLMLIGAFSLFSGISGLKDQIFWLYPQEIQKLSRINGLSLHSKFFIGDDLLLLFLKFVLDFPQGASLPYFRKFAFGKQKIFLYFLQEFSSRTLILWDASR